MGVRSSAVDFGSCNNQGSFKQPEISSWGGSPIFAEGRYHLFASEFTGGCGLGTWMPRSHIVHAASDSMLGPYVRLPPPHDVVLPTFAHNPTIRLHPDGTYLLFFIGRTVRNMSAPTNWTLESSISLAFSRSVYGPWEVIRHIILPGQGEGSADFDADATNPSPIIMADGSVLLLYRGNFRPHGGRGLPCWNRIGMARSNSWRGPYTRISSHCCHSTSATKTPWAGRTAGERSILWHILWHRRTGKRAITNRSGTERTRRTKGPRGGWSQHACCLHDESELGGRWAHPGLHARAAASTTCAV